MVADLSVCIQKTAPKQLQPRLGAGGSAAGGRALPFPPHLP